MRSFILGTFLCVVLSGGCAKYTTGSLEPLKQEFHRSASTIHDVSVCVEQLDAARCKQAFCRDIQAMGYQPVQFTIANNSKKYILLNCDNINLPSASPQAVAEACHFNTAGRATTYGVIGVFIWPFLIPAIVDGAGSAKANGQMDIDYAAKALNDEVVMPYGKVNGVLYVPRSEMSENISMRLICRETGECFRFRWTDGMPVEAVIESPTTLPAHQTEAETVNTSHAKAE